MALPSSDCFEITPEDTAACLAGSGTTPVEEIRLIDCREQDEYALCRIAEAELMQLSGFAEAAPLKFANHDGRPVIVYCHHGMRSMQATMFLRRLGIENAWSMSGGIDAWSRTVDSSVPCY